MKYRTSSLPSLKMGRLLSAVALISACAVSVSACAGGGDDDEDEDADADSDGAGGADGGSTGGSTGTGGGASSVCDVEGATTVPASTAISNLDVGMGGAAGNPLEGWDAFPASPDKDLPPAAGATGVFTHPTDWEDSPGMRYPELMEDGPAGGDSHSVRFGGTGFKNYGAGFNFALSVGPTCVDISSYAGVKFWARGWTKVSDGQTLPGDVVPNAGKVFFRIITPGSNQMPNGDCDASVPNHSCFQPPQVAITLPGDADGDDLGEWKQYTVLFEDLATIHAPSSLAANKDRAQFVGWFSSPGDFDFEVTGVEWCAEVDCGASVLE